MVVRDYECDIQGIVNNAVYQNYNEHCRSCFIASLGIEFADHRRGSGTTQHALQNIAPSRR